MAYRKRSGSCAVGSSAKAISIVVVIRPLETLNGVLGSMGGIKEFGHELYQRFSLRPADAISLGSTSTANPVDPRAQNRQRRIHTGSVDRLTSTGNGIQIFRGEGRLFEHAF